MEKYLNFLSFPSYWKTVTAAKKGIAQRNNKDYFFQCIAVSFLILSHYFKIRNGQRILKAEQIVT